MLFFFFKQKTAYEMRISDWSSDVCSSDLGARSSGRHLVDFLDDPHDRIRIRVAEGSIQPLVVQPSERRLVQLPGIHDAVAGQPLDDPPPEADLLAEIGRASCRERVCPYV